MGPSAGGAVWAGGISRGGNPKLWFGAGIGGGMGIPCGGIGIPGGGPDEAGGMNEGAAPAEREEAAPGWARAPGNMLPTGPGGPPRS